jgi:hypothetical protein
MQVLSSTFMACPNAWLLMLMMQNFCAGGGALLSRQTPLGFPRQRNPSTETSHKPAPLTLEVRREDDDETFD